MSGETNVSILGRIKMVLQGRQIGGDQEAENEQDVLLTGDRSLSLWAKIVGHDGTRERIVKVESSRELATVLHGKDSDGNVDALRTNVEKQLQVEVIGVGASSTVGVLFSMVLLELRLMNIHLGQISGLDDATTNDVEGND